MTQLRLRQASNVEAATNTNVHHDEMKAWVKHAVQYAALCYKHHKQCCTSSWKDT